MSSPPKPTFWAALSVGCICETWGCLMGHDMIYVSCMCKKCTYFTARRSLVRYSYGPMSVWCLSQLSWTFVEMADRIDLLYAWKLPSTYPISPWQVDLVVNKTRWQLSLLTTSIMAVYYTSVDFNTLAPWLLWLVVDLLYNLFLQ